MRVEFAREARKDLADITRFIASDNLDAALAFVDAVEAVADELADMPERFEEVTQFGGSIRRRVYRGYVIFYRVETERVVSYASRTARASPMSSSTTYDPPRHHRPMAQRYFLF